MGEMRTRGAWSDEVKGAWRIRVKMNNTMVAQETDNLVLDWRVGLGDVNGGENIPDSVKVKVPSCGEVAKVVF